jgi:hypothetical protein
MRTTTTAPVFGAGVGVTASSADTGVTAVPIGPSVGRTFSDAIGAGLGAQPGPRLTTNRPSMRALPAVRQRLERDCTTVIHSAPVTG